MFYIIGLGLGDCKDITVKGLEIIKKCERVYLEAYTSVLTVGTEALVYVYESFNAIYQFTMLLLNRKNIMDVSCLSLTENWWSKGQMIFWKVLEMQTWPYWWSEIHLVRPLTPISHSGPRRKTYLVRSCTTRPS